MYHRKSVLTVRLLCLVLVWLCQAAQAKEPASHSYIPARFGTGSDSLLAQLKCPKRINSADNTVVYCRAQVRADGTTARRSYCFGNDLHVNPFTSRVMYANGRYVEATQDALTKAKFLPAKVDGAAVPVRFWFRVVFENRDDCLTTAYPNLGELPEMGLGYVAPQEILVDGPWASRWNVSAYAINYGEVGVLFSMSVMVGVTGEAGDGRVENANSILSEQALQAGLAAYQAAKFIPGFYRGAPRPMRHLDMYFSGPPSPKIPLDSQLKLPPSPTSLPAVPRK